MDNDWYASLAAAMKRKERAELYLTKWGDELREAEEDIKDLVAMQTKQDTVTEPLIQWTPNS
jgi:hypothetical protein